MLLVAEVKSELVSLEFKLAGEDIHQKLDDSVHGGQSIGEEDETDHDGVDGVEAKRSVERVVVNEDGEQGENV